jgi:phosphomevalonate kinase
MRRVAASAPGKLVLSGEYAVLDGAAAIAAAIDRRALVSIDPRDGECHTLVAPGYSDIPAMFTQDGRTLCWIESEADFKLFEQVWLESGVSPTGAVDVTLDTRAFHDPDHGDKLGIGSSSALAAALATALSGLGGESPAKVAGSAHRSFQGGRGSGVDVAASLSGGVIRYRVGDDAPGPLPWPKGLHYAVYWSSTSSDTRGKLERFEQQPATEARQELVVAADRFAAVFVAGDVQRIVTGLGVYCSSLRRFDAEFRLGIYGAGHELLANTAADHGVVYKPCGAGGGDIGIALATSADALDSFSTAATHSGFRHVDARIDPLGAVLTGGRQA